MENTEDQIKIVLLGDPGVGKSSILLQFISNEFDPSVESTVGVSFKTKEVNITGKIIKLNIWDTAGQEKYQSLTKMYCRGARAAILVYDITKRETFENLKKWHQSVLEIGNPNTLFAVVGNKEDLVDRECIDLNEARQYAARIGGIYKKVSARSNFGIEELFQSLSHRIFPGLKSSTTSSLKLDEISTPRPSAKKNCCG